MVEVHTSTTAGVLQAELAADPADEVFGIDAELGEQAFVFVGVDLLGQLRLCLVGLASAPTRAVSTSPKANRNLMRWAGRPWEAQPQQRPAGQHSWNPVPSEAY